MHQYPSYNVENNGQAVASGPGMTIWWQKGPVSEGVNGALPELPVRALIEHVRELQQVVPCRQNEDIIQLLHEVLWLFDDRTRERHARGVLGTEER